MPLGRLEPWSVATCLRMMCSNTGSFAAIRTSRGVHVNGSVDVCRPSKGVPHISKVPGFASPRPAANCRDLPRHTAAAGSPPGPRHRTETTKPSGAQSDPTPRQILLAGSALRIDLRWTAQYSRILRIETDLAVDFAQLERAWRIDQPPNP